MIDKDRLRMARLQLRKTQESLGKTIGQDQSYISRLERGELSEITVTTLERLADALQVSADYLLGRKKRNKKQEERDSEPSPIERALVGAESSLDG